MNQSIMKFFQEKVEELEKIQRSVNENNCFSKLVEYFQVCHEVSRRERAIINANFGGLEQVISLFLLNLPYCQLEYGDLNVIEQCKDDKFLGCCAEDQKYAQSFVGESVDYRPMIFTFRDCPSKESITIYDNGINRTIAYIENNEKDPRVIMRLKELVYHHFFGCQKETLQDYFVDRAIFYMMVASKFRVSRMKS